MGKNEAKSKLKSTRKPLRDVSNSVRPSKSVKKKAPQIEEEPLDRLLLLHSHISTLIHQIDELVVQALKVTSKKGRKEIEYFANVLSDMQTSLKPWVPRFQKLLSSPSVGIETQLEESLTRKTVHPVNEDKRKVDDSPENTKLDFLVSPSPLVCWRGDSTTENGRQLFMLTPLPRPKPFSPKILESSKSVFENITANTTVGPPSKFSFSEDTNDDLLEGIAVKPTPCRTFDSVLLEGVAVKPTPCKPNDFVPTNMESTRGFVSPAPCKMVSSMFAMTPCLKMSPPKSCVLLEPISEVAHKNNRGFRKSTPFPIGVQKFSGSQDSESSDDEVSEDLSLKYPELFGIKPAHKLGNGKKVVEESPNWFMSPPKTCILMEPPDKKLLTDAATSCKLPITFVNQQTNRTLRKEKDIQDSHIQTKKSCNQEIESTPMFGGVESTMRTGKRPGENTLKKELWTKFEAASTCGIHFDVSVLQETAHKGFLDRLEEVSSDEASPLPEGPR